MPREAVDFFAETPTPPAFDAWVDKVTRQQEMIARNCHD